MCEFHGQLYIACAKELNQGPDLEQDNSRHGVLGLHYQNSLYFVSNINFKATVLNLIHFRWYKIYKNTLYWKRNKKYRNLEQFLKKSYHFVNFADMNKKSEKFAEICEYYPCL